MKKSNLILVIAFSLTFIWTIILGLLGSSVIQDNKIGKESSFAVSHQKHAVLDIPGSSIPVNGLSVTGEGSVLLSITRGKELSLECRRAFWDYIKTSNRNGKILICINRLPSQGEQINITIPEISSVSIDSVFQVYIKGLSQKALHIRCSNVAAFSADSCKIGSFSLDLPGKNKQHDVNISGTNFVDSLSASIDGYGFLRLGIIGKFKNQIRLSDRIEIRTSADLMKQLSIENLNPAGNK
jgi:hypothetical protein